MLNEHPLKIRINTLEDMFKQINILGNAEMSKHNHLIDLKYDNPVWWYEGDTDHNIRVNKRLGVFYSEPNKLLEIYVYVSMLGEVIIQSLHRKDVRYDYKCEYSHLGKFFTKKQTNELKNYMIEHYDKNELEDYAMTELREYKGELI